MILSTLLWIALKLILRKFTILSLIFFTLASSLEIRPLYFFKVIMFLARLSKIASILFSSSSDLEFPSLFWTETMLLCKNLILILIWLISLKKSLWHYELINYHIPSHPKKILWIFSIKAQKRRVPWQMSWKRRENIYVLTNPMGRRGRRRGTQIGVNIFLIH